MAKKRRLTTEECKKQFPEAWQDANGRKDIRIKGKIELAMVHMINEGELWPDAKLKALCIALPPDHFEQVPAAGPFPRLLYHEDGIANCLCNRLRFSPVADANFNGHRVLGVSFSRAVIVARQRSGMAIALRISTSAYTYINSPLIKS